MKTFNVYRNTSKGQLMDAAYLGNTSNLDSAIPLETVRTTGMDTWYYVMDYQTNYFGKIVNLLEKARENEVQVVFHF